MVVDFTIMKFHIQLFIQLYILQRHSFVEPFLEQNATVSVPMTKDKKSDFHPQIPLFLLCWLMET
jgi:hypothetical protein